MWRLAIPTHAISIVAFTALLVMMDASFCEDPQSSYLNPQIYDATILFTEEVRLRDIILPASTPTFKFCFINKIALAWHARWTLPKALHMSSRILPFFDVVLKLYRTFLLWSNSHTPSLTQRS